MWNQKCKPRPSSRPSSPPAWSWTRAWRGGSLPRRLRRAHRVLFLCQVMFCSLPPQIKSRAMAGESKTRDPVRTVSLPFLWPQSVLSPSPEAVWTRARQHLSTCTYVGTHGNTLYTLHTHLEGSSASLRPPRPRRGETAGSPSCRWPTMQVVPYQQTFISAFCYNK